MSEIYYSHAQAIGSAVRAELARSGKSISSLAPVLGIGRTAIYARTRGEQPFDYSELQAIAQHLGISATELVKSAERASA